MMELARRHWLLSLTLFAHAAILVFVPDAWTRQIEGHTRTGMAFHMSAASRDLWIVGIALVVYVLSGLGVSHPWGMRAPSDGEVAVGRWIARATAIGALWVGLYITI